MSEAADIAEFQRKLRQNIARFIQDEPGHRAEYERRVVAGTTPPDLYDDLLERLTRRYLIDPMLRDLGWNPDDPRQVLEEARSWADNGERLYFDYLGIDSNRMPIFLVEAKAFDSEAPRPPRESEINGQKMAQRLSKSLHLLKVSDRPIPTANADETSKAVILAEWVNWLRNLVVYIRSLGNPQQRTLQRVVITAGRWLIIFSNPTDAFLGDNAPELSYISCYVSFDDIDAQAGENFQNHQRGRLSNTLPLTLSLGQALELISRTAIDRVFRGLVIATTIVGPVRGSYPKRSMYPSIVLETGNRLFAVTDYEGFAAEEPNDGLKFGDFLRTLDAIGNRFETEVLARFGIDELRPSPASEVRRLAAVDVPNPALPPVPGSTSAWVSTLPDLRLPLVIETAERHSQDEYLVITGQSWFYKRELPFGPVCELHSFGGAKRNHVAGDKPHMGQLVTSFTASDQLQHCAHRGIQGMRADRCVLDRIETHLCCRTCIFHDLCWCEPDDISRLPCP